MSAIANFKKRRQAQREQQAQTADTLEVKAVPENEALHLLAELIGCDIEDAITEARKLVDKAAYIAWKYAEPSSWQEAEPSSEADSTNAIEQAADAVNSSAENISDAASTLDDTASQLAYSADDIGNATAELKEATAELKKPLAVPQSSRGVKAEKPKNSSKKSG